MRLQSTSPRGLSCKQPGRDKLSFPTQNQTLIYTSTLSINRSSYEDLVFQTLLGSGSFGDAYKGVWRGSTQVAIKKMRSGLIDDDGFASFVKEIKMLADLDHPHVIGFMGYVSDKRYPPTHTPLPPLHPKLKSKQTT